MAKVLDKNLAHLRGQHYRLATNDLSRFSESRVVGNTTYFYGVFFDVFLYIADYAGFTLTMAHEELAGTWNANSSEWSGSMGALQRGEVDFAADMIGVNEYPKANDYFYFMQPPIGEFPRAVMVFEPKIHPSYNLERYLDFTRVFRPVKSAVWYCIFGMLLLCGGISVCIDYLQDVELFSYLTRFGRVGKGGGGGFGANWYIRFFQYISHLEIYFRLLTRQDIIPLHHTKYWSLKFTVFCWAFSCLILLSLYEAELTSTLTIDEGRPPPFTDVESMDAAGYYFLSYEHGASWNLLTSLEHRMIDLERGDQAAFSRIMKRSRENLCRNRTERTTRLKEIMQNIETKPSYAAVLVGSPPFVQNKRCNHRIIQFYVQTVEGGWIVLVLFTYVRFSFFSLFFSTSRQFLNKS